MRRCAEGRCKWTWHLTESLRRNFTGCAAKIFPHHDDGKAIAAFRKARLTTAGEIHAAWQLLVDDWLELKVVFN
jgi:hypothetical protein